MLRPVDRLSGLADRGQQWARHRGQFIGVAGDRSPDVLLVASVAAADRSAHTTDAGSGSVRHGLRCLMVVVVVLAALLPIARCP